jgi:hypothetical protein
MRIAVIVFGLVAVPVLNAQRQLPPLMPPDREMALAESAAPRSVTEEASIFLLHRATYVRYGPNRACSRQPGFNSSCPKCLDG